MSLIVPSLDLNLIEYTQSKVKSIIYSKKLRPSVTYRDKPVYFIEDRDPGYVVLYDHDEEEVLYFVEHKRLQQNGLSGGRQILLWRKEGHPASAGFARHVFFLFLLPKFKTLMADTEQTKDGRAFWQYIMGEAVNMRHHVYAFDGRVSPEILHSITTARELNGHRDLLWGHTDQHTNTFGIVSRVPLHLTLRA